MDNKRTINISKTFATLSIVLTLSSCASTYGNLVSGSNLGAKEYQPAVLVPPENQALYNQLLPLCRKVAVNRQITASEQAQLSTITGVTEGTASGLSFGLQMAGQLKGLGISDVDIGETAGYGMLGGLIGSLASSFSSGTESAAEKTRTTLLSCLRAGSKGGTLWEVLE